MDTPEPKRQRWYDLDHTVSKSITLLETFPEAIQQAICDAIIRLAERYCQADELMSNLRSLGPDKVLGIFKSKNKRRSYDSNITVHQAMNYLYILSPEDRQLIANQVIALVNCIYGYLKSCKHHAVDADLQHVQRLITAFIAEGITGVSQLMQEIEVDLVRAARLNQLNAKWLVTADDDLNETASAALNAANKQSPLIPQNDEALTEDEWGLRIRDDKTNSNP